MKIPIFTPEELRENMLTQQKAAELSVEPQEMQLDEDELSAEQKQAFEKLDKIEHGLGNVHGDLGKVKERIDLEIVKLFAFVWFKKTFKTREPGFWNSLRMSMLHKQALAIVERLMKSLIELDTVESNGHDEIRNRRRALVGRINKELLPEADKLVLFAKKRLEFHTNHKDVEIIAPQTEDDDEEEAYDMDVSSEEEDNNEDENKPEEEEEVEKEEEANKATSTSRRQQLRYEVEEFPSYMAIKCLAPETMLSHDDIKVVVNRQTGKMEILVRGYEPLEFDVRSASIDALKTSYRLGGPNFFVVKIPKAVPPQRRRSPMQQPSPSAYYYDPYMRSRRYIQRPFSVWG